MTLIRVWTGQNASKIYRGLLRLGFAVRAPILRSDGAWVVCYETQRKYNTLTLHTQPRRMTGAW